MAQDAVDAVCRRLGVVAGCRTGEHRLVGATGYDTDFWKKIRDEYGLESEIAQHLARQYGTRAVEVAALAQENPVWGGRLAVGFPFLKAEVVYAVRHEMAASLRDVLARRIRLEILDWQATIATAPTAAQIMGPELGWTQQQIEQETEAYIGLIREFQRRASSA